MDSPGKHPFLSELAELDWDFVGQAADTGLSRFHWHPARFPPQIPSIAIGALSSPGDRVLDPFCGSGTTLVEGRSLGRKVLGIDTNPIAIMIASAKLAELSGESFDHYRRALLRRVDERLGASGGQLEALSGVVPHLDEQRLWYHDRTLAELAAIWDALHTLEDPFRLVAQASFSAILRAVCSQDKHWGWICDNVRPRALVYKDAVAAFGAKLSEYAHALPESTGGRHLEATAVQGTAADILSHHPERSFDLFVTSPPYFGVTDYAKAQRLSYLWFDLSLENVRLSETGARSKRRRATARADFLQEISASFGEVARVLRKDAYGVLVLGESSARASYVSDVESLLVAKGLRIVERLDRSLPTQRSLIATLQGETILVCRRD